jgi:type II secretory pathway pseudopilin PulG
MAARCPAGERVSLPEQRQGGFTYIGLLAMVVIIGLMLTMASRVWSTTEQRERETQLLFIGHAYRAAIASYFATGHHYPESLQELLQDDRFPVPKRHLRRLYADPMTGKADWTLVLTPDGQGVMGIASSSRATPIKLDGFTQFDDAFKNSDCYCSWRFVYYANRYNRSIPLPGTDGANGQDTKSSGSLGTFKPGSINALPASGATLSPRGGGLSGPSNNELQQNGSVVTESASDPN